MNRAEPKNATTLFKWIWHSYLKTALIPLILVELVFIGIYFVTNNWSQNEMVGFLREEVQMELSQIAEQEGNVIEQQITSITNATELYRQQTARALQTPAKLAPEDVVRLAYSPEGVYYTTRDKVKDGVAIFYSGFVPIGETEREKVACVLTTEELMIDIQKSQPLAASIYLNTFDSLNIIYPYFDVISQYAPLMDIPSYNFYYEADAKNNPQKVVKWTDAYLDPAGHGWMASAIAPVYNGDFLEGVVGIDVTVSTITNQVLNLNIPWQGYGVLVGKDGTILALPEKGEGEWGLTELTDHHYNEAILKDTFKPEQFNLYKRNEISELAQKVATNNNGFSDVLIGQNDKVVSWTTVPETGWKLLLIVNEENIYSRVNEMSSKLFKIGSFMIAGLVFFYCIFLLILFKKSRIMSLNISEPLLKINQIVQKIGAGDYYQNISDLDVVELQETALKLIKMGEKLGNTNQELIDIQEELKKRGADLQALVNSIDDVIMKVNEQGECLNIWAKDEELLEASFKKKNMANIYIGIIKRVIETGETEKIEYVLQTPKGLRTFQARISLISNATRTVSISARDITERIEMEKSLIAAKDEAEKASNAKSEFLSSMSHELRTPLNSVLGFAQILKVDPTAPLNESQSESVEEIIKAGKHLLILINEVLDMAKIESGKMSVSLEPVLIKPIIDETIALIKPLAKLHNVEIIPLASECVGKYVKADSTRFKQVILNLISNAVKYNKDMGRVKINCEQIGGVVRINFVDTGIGIPDTELEAIFDPFYRLDAAESYREGTGIGLTVAKQLIELMGGSIGVESKVGEGSHFWIELPHVENKKCFDHASYEFFEDKNNKERIRVKKVLYVEDNPANRNLVHRIIKDYKSVEVYFAENGRTSLELVSKEKFDLIILDINLPDTDGYELLQHLKMLPETKDIPVIALTANAMSRDIIRGKEAGFEEYMTKPIDIEKFKKVIFKYFSDI
ncbi:MAG: histidine kinase [Firmicutes bacterium HGW-Firmicutes-12]|nr:MAG: histidine kinase [Firmicutes bacterium HGW-Firmicutes-12]